MEKRVERGVDEFAVVLGRVGSILLGEPPGVLGEHDTLVEYGQHQQQEQRRHHSHERVDQHPRVHVTSNTNATNQLFLKNN